ncbi:hypothetical protein IPN35_01405 [Candidatus Peregrinibacteria bacterium]|nr:MAG: hypothetical protein IPN35_01405 [Candidatus Peregrinibacteria bacterium]
MPKIFSSFLHLFSGVIWRSFVWGFFFILISSTVRADTEITDLGAVQTFNEYISVVWAWAANIILLLAVAGVVVGGILLTLSAGNENRADMGRTTIRGSIIGMSIVLLSGTIRIFIFNIVPENQDSQNLGGAFEALHSLINGLLGLVGGAAAVGIIISGIKYMTSSGDFEKLDSSRRSLKLSLWGLGIALGAWGILAYVVNIF